jgi:hypothetical protein
MEVPGTRQMQGFLPLSLWERVGVRGLLLPLSLEGEGAGG